MAEITVISCDTCAKEIGEKHTKTVDKGIKIQASRESNIWFGDVSNWLPGLLLKEDLTFCKFECFIDWLEGWHFEMEKEKFETAKGEKKNG